MNDKIFQINNFVTFSFAIKDPKNVIDVEDKIRELFIEINKIQLALFSSISSLIVFIKDKKPLLMNEISNKQENIINLYNNYIANKTDKIIFNKKLLQNLKDWVSLANRIDITQIYLKVGNIMDHSSIVQLFPLHITKLNKRPLNTSSFKSLEHYQKENWMKKEWNLCSLYGIEYLFSIEKKGIDLLKKLKKDIRTSEMFIKMVSFYFNK